MLNRGEVQLLIKARMARNTADEKIILEHIRSLSNSRDDVRGQILEGTSSIINLEDKNFEELREMGKLAYVRDNFPKQYERLYTERFKNVSGAMNKKLK